MALNNTIQMVKSSLFTTLVNTPRTTTVPTAKVRTSSLTLLKSLTLLLMGMAFFVGGVEGQGTETFTNICTSSCSPAASSYGTRTWTGDNGNTSWSATDARTDQTITSNAITIRNGGLTFGLTASQLSAGIANLTINARAPFGSPDVGTLQLVVNGTTISSKTTTGSFVSSVVSYTWTAINVATITSIVINQTTNNSRITIDDISWTSYSASTNFYWNGANTSNGGSGATGGSGTWNTSTTNWIKTTNNSSGTASAWTNSTSNIANLSNGTGTITMGTSITAGGLNVSTTGYTLAPNTTISLISPVTLTNSLTVAPSSGTFTMSGIISGSGGLTNTTGTTVLSGANTYTTGGTTLTSGTLQVGVASVGSVGSITSSAVGGGTLNLNGGVFSSSSTTAYSIFNPFTIGGNVTIGDGTNTGALTFGAAGTISGATRTITTPSAVTLSGAIGDGGSAYGLTKAGSSTLTLGGSNTFTGGVTVNAGTIVLGNAGALNSTTPNAVTMGGGTLSLNGNSVTVSSLSGASGTVNNNHASTATTLTVNTTGTPSYTGTLVDGSTAALALTKSGSGTLTLSGSNTYTGATTISAGTLKLGNNNSIPTSTALSVAGTLDLSGWNQTIGSLTGAGTVDNSLNFGLTFTVGNTSNTTFSGTIANTVGTVPVVKQGSGTLTLTGANTYTGTTTVNAGTLQLNRTGGATLSSSTATTISGGTLQISKNQTLSSLTLSSGNLTIDASTTLTISGAFAFSGGTITNNGTLVVNGITFSGNGSLVLPGVVNMSSSTFVLSGTTSVSVTGTLTDNGVSGYTTSATYLSFSSTASFISNINAGIIPLATWNAASTVTVQGITNNSTLPLGLGQTFGNFTWNCTGQTVFVNGLLSSNPAFTTAGTFTVASTGSGGISLVASTTTSYATTFNALTVSGGLLELSYSVASTVGIATIKVTNDVTLSGGVLNVGDGSAASTSSYYVSILQIGGNLNISSTSSYMYASSSNTNSGLGLVMFTGASSTYSSVATNTNSNKRINFAVATGTTLSLSTTLKLNAASGAQYAASLYVAGTLSTGATNTISDDAASSSGNGVFIYGNSSFSSNSATTNLSNIITPTSTSGIIAGMSVTGTGIPANTYVADVFGSTVVLTSNATATNASTSLTFANTTNFITANANGIAALGTASGAILTTANRFYSQSANYEFRGASTGNFQTTTYTTINGYNVYWVNNLTINSGGTTAAQNFLVNGTLAMTAGILTTSTTNMVYIGSTSNTAITGYTSAKYINGPLARTFTASLSSGTTYVFPVGKGGNYLPFSINPVTGGTAPVIRVEATNASAVASGATVDASMQSLNTSEYWNTSVLSGSFTSAILSATGLTSIATGYTLASSATLGGVYTTINGIASTPSVNNSSSVSSLGYYVIGLKSAPVITAAVGATVDGAFTATFTDDATWRAAITSVTVGGTILTAGYSISAGQIVFTPSTSSPANLLQTSGLKTIAVIATNYPTTSFTQAIGVGAVSATQSTLTPTAPSITVAGTQVLTVTAKDQYGNTLSTGGATVTITQSGGTGSIGSVTDNSNGTYTATVTSPTATGSGTFVATLGGSTVNSGGGSQTTATVTYVSGTATKLVITGSSTQTAGVAQNITITAQDTYGNTATTYTGSKSLTFSGANSSTSPVTAATVTNASASAVNFGTATSITFTNGVSTAGGSMKLYKAESASISASDGAINATANTLAVTVSAGTASKFIITGTGTQTAGGTQSITITATDAYGNTDLTYAGSKSLTFSGANNSSSPSTSPTATNSSAVATNFGTATAVTFTSGVGTSTLALYKAETALIVATSTITTSGSDRLSVAVSASTATKLGVSGTLSAVTTAGTLASQTVAVQDQYGNTVTGSTAAITATASVSPTWTIGGTTSVNSTSGSATFNAITATNASGQTGAYVIFASSGLTSVNSGTFNINTVSYASFSSSGSGTYINSFSVTGITNISTTSTGFGTSGYANYSSTQIMSSYPGATVPFALDLFGGTAGIAVYVDWNNTGSFTNVYTSNAYKSTGSIFSTFTVPGGQALGNYRMRVVVDYNSTNPSSSGSITRGEAEDYTLTVVAKPLAIWTLTNSATPAVSTNVTGTAITSASFGSGITAGGTGTANASYFDPDNYYGSFGLGYTSASSFDATEYIQFQVKSATGYTFNLSNIVMNAYLSAFSASTNPATQNLVDIYYSTSPSFTSPVKLNNSTLNFSTPLAQNGFSASFYDAPMLSVNLNSGNSTLPSNLSAGGTLYFRVYMYKANNSGDFFTIPSFTVQGTVASLPAITSSLTASSTFGNGTTYQITASNSPTSYTATGLPTGMTYNSSTGLITIGATTAAGTYNISLSASNASGTGNSSTLVYTVYSIPTQIAFTAVPSGAAAGTGFSVTVQSQDGSGNVALVTTDTYIQLSLNAGTGVLSGNGTTAGVYFIPNGSSSVTISGVLYNTAETGVQLNATATAGMSLTTGVSSAFGVFTTEPTAQPTSFVRSAVNPTDMTIGWSAASGTPAGYIVLRTTASGATYPNTAPVDGTTYTVGGTLGNATVAYVGSGVSSGVISSLTANSQYSYSIYSYNGSGTTINYYTTSPLQGQPFTLATEPTAQPTTFSLSSITNGTATLTVSSGNGAGVAVFLKSTTPVDFVPTDGVSYTAGANAAFGSGTQYGTGNYLVLVSATAPFTVNITGLSSQTTYNIGAYAYNGLNSSASNNFLSTAGTSSFTTLATAPTAQATGLTFGSVTASGFNVSFTAATGSPAGYLVLRNAGSAVTGTPVGGTAYTVGQTNIGGGTNTVAYVGALPSPNFTESLNDGTTYYYSVYSYNGSATSISYFTTSPLTGNQATSALTAPVATAATSISYNSFTANWNGVTGVSPSNGYRLDVATTSSFNTSSTPASDNFESGALTSWTSGATSWTANNSTPLTGTYSARLNGSAAGSYYLSMSPSTYDVTAGTTTWRLKFKTSFSPSGNNNAYFYLMSDKANLVASSPIGYAVGFNFTGTSDDKIKLWQVNGGSGTVVVASTQAVTSGTTYAVEVTRTSAGLWSLSYNILGSFASMTTAGTATDATYTTSTYAGMLANVTVSNITNFKFDDFSVTQSISTTLASYNDLPVTPNSQIVTTGVAAGTDYYYRVRAIGASGVTTASSNVIGPVTTLNDPSTADYRSKTSGNYGDATTWEYNSTGSTWVDAIQAPGSTNNVTILSSHIVNMNSSNVTIGAGKTLTVNGTLVANAIVSGTGSFVMGAGGTLNVYDAAGITSLGTGTGNIQTTGARTFATTANYNYYQSASTAQVTGTGLPSTVASLGIYHTGASNNTVTLTSAVTTTGALTVNSGSLLSGNNAISVGGVLTVASGSILDMGTAALSGSSLTTSGTGILRTQNTGATPMPSGRTWTMDVEYNAAGDQTVISGASHSFNNIIFSTGGIKTASAISNISGTITINNGATLSAGTSAVGGTGTNITINGTGRFITGGSGTKPDATGTYTLSTSSTVEFAGSSATSIRQKTYGNIDISGTNVTIPSGGLTLGGTGNTLTVKNGATINVSSTGGLSGAASNVAVLNTNSPTTPVTLASGSTVNYTGAAQTITSRSDYFNLSFSAAGVKTLAGNCTVANTLTLSNGVVTTGSNKLTLAAPGTVAVTAGSYVNGNFEKLIASGTSTKTFEIGDATVYSPVTVAITGTVSNSTGAIMASTTSGEHAAIATSGIDASKSVNRTWTLTNTAAITGLTSYSPTFTYVAGDVDGTATPASFVVRNYSGSAWATTTTGSLTSTTSQATGVTNYGDFAIGESTGNPVVGTQPNDATVCIGSGTTFTSSATGTPSPTVKWQRNSGSGYVDITANLDAGTVYSGFNTGMLTLTGSANSLSGYLYRAVFTNINGSTNSNPATLTTVNTWTGITSTDWSVGSNWCSGSAPSSGDNVSIPNTSNLPVLVAATTVGSIQIASGATLDFNGYTLTINGAVTGSGQFKGSASSSLVIAGTAGTITFASNNNTIKNLTLTNGATATLGATLNITAGASSGTVTIGTSGTGTALNTGGYLVLKSDEFGTSRIAQVFGTLSGDVTIERYISAKSARRFSFIASPVTQTFRNAWQQQIYITGAGNGGIACGSTTGNGQAATDKYNDQGFDVAQSNAATVLKFVAIPVNKSHYVGISNTTSTYLSPGTGYSVNVRGNRNSATVTCADQLGSLTPTAPEAVTLSATGPVTTGTLNTVALNTLADYKYTLLGNPYPSQIDFSLFRSTNSSLISNKMWTYSPVVTPGSSSNFTTYFGGYIINGPDGYNDANGKYLASGQAFIVEAIADGNVTFNEAHKTNGAVPNASFFGTSQDKVIRVGFYNTANTKLDEILLIYNKQGTKSYSDKLDATSFSLSSQSLVSYKGDNRLVFATRPDTTVDDTVQLGVGIKAGTYSLAFSQMETLDSTQSVTLLDKFLGTATDVRKNSTYNFTVTSDTASKGANRFKVVLSGAVPLPVNFVDVSATKNLDGVLVKWQIANEAKIASYSVERSIDGVHFTAIKNSKATGASSYAIQDASLPASVNTLYYRVKATDNLGKVSYTKVITLKLVTANNLLSIYPNPVQSKLNITVADAISGSLYNVKITTATGKLAFAKADAPVSGKSITFDASSLAAGVYMIELTDSKGNKLVDKFVKQ